MIETDTGTALYAIPKSDALSNTNILKKSGRTAQQRLLRIRPSSAGKYGHGKSLNTVSTLNVFKQMSPASFRFVRWLL